MNTYLALAYVVDILHVILIIFLIYGFCTTMVKEKNRTFYFIHGTVVYTAFFTQMLCNFACPMVVLSGHLRALGDPEYELAFFHKPFIVGFMKDVFGLEISDMVVVMMMLIFVVACTVTLVHAVMNQETLSTESE